MVPGGSPCHDLLVQHAGKEWSVSLVCDTSRVPPAVLRLARSQLEEMGRAVQLIDAANPFWTSIRESGLRIDIEGWRFHFRIEAERAVLTKVEIASIA